MQRYDRNREQTGTLCKPRDNLSSLQASHFGRSSFQAHSSCFRDNTNLPLRRMILLASMFGDGDIMIVLRNEGVVMLVCQEKVALKD
jgi:hypothetical protein